MRAEQSLRDSSDADDMQPPTFAPEGKVAVLTASQNGSPVARTSVLDAVRSGELPPMGTPSAITQTLAPAVEEPPVIEPPASDNLVAPARRRRRWPWLAAAAVVIAGISGGAYAYADHYSDHAVPGTKVGGITVSGKTQQQIATIVAQESESVHVTITGDVTGQATLADLGTEVDAEATAAAALEKSHGLLSRFTALFTDNTVSVVSHSHPATAKDYANALIPEDKTKAVDAGVVLASDGTTFTITPASDGTGVDSAPLADAAQRAADALDSQSVALTFTTAPPAVSDADAQAVADKANAMVALDVTVSTSDGEESYTADAATKASWIVVTAQADASPTLSIDSTKVSQWVAQQTSEIDREPVAGVRNLNSAGQVVATSVQAVNGIAVTNAEDISTAIAKSLTDSQAYSGTFETSEVEAGWTDRTIADGAENLVYPAAPGEKWVDVNLTAKTVTAYEGATVVHGPVTVVDGKASTPTVVGTYHVYLKYAKQDMGCSAGFDYCSKDVLWVTYFTGSYALHGAPWWSSWGFSASHGCVNMPVDEAKWIYNWSEIGTTVVTHY